MNRGQEVSTVWAPGPGLLGSFLIPGLVGVVGPWRSTAAATSDLLTVSWGTRASCQTPQARPGPRASAASCSPMGRLRPQTGEGRPAAPEPPVRTGSFPPVPPPHTGGAGPLRKPTCGTSPGTGARLCGCPVGRGQMGCLISGSADARLLGPRAVAKPAPPHASRPSAGMPFILLGMLPRARPGLRGEEREAAGCPGASAAFPGPERAGGTSGGTGAREPKPTGRSWMDPQASCDQKGRETQGSRWCQNTWLGSPTPILRRRAPTCPLSQPSSRPWPVPQPGPAFRKLQPSVLLGGAGPEAPEGVTQGPTWDLGQV